MTCRPLGVFLICAALAGSARGEGAATRPAGDATTPAEKQMAIWVLGLTDGNASVRARSRDALLSLKREDLEVLKKGLEPLAPLENRIATELRDIVTHVFLTGEKYDQDPMGFLGITMGPVDVDAPRTPVIVVSRMPGFAGYGALRDGDLIVDVEEHNLDQPASVREFIRTIARCRPGEQIHLKVERDGKTMRLPVKLSGRPADPGENPWQYDVLIQELVNRRYQKAEAHWEANFAALFGKPAEGR